MNYQTLERTIGHSFADIALLDLAMTHPSYALQHKCQDNQRLEFLGDAVLEICVSRVLYHKYPKLREGQLTRKDPKQDDLFDDLASRRERPVS